MDAGVYDYQYEKRCEGFQFRLGSEPGMIVIAYDFHAEELAFFNIS